MEELEGSAILGTFFMVYRKDHEIPSFCASLSVSVMARFQLTHKSPERVAAGSHKLVRTAGRTPRHYWTHIPLTVVHGAPRFPKARSGTVV